MIRTTVQNGSYIEVVYDTSKGQSIAYQYHEDDRQESSKRPEDTPKTRSGKGKGKKAVKGNAKSKNVKVHFKRSRSTEEDEEDEELGYNRNKKTKIQGE